jgi:hypothetical protein
MTHRIRPAVVGDVPSVLIGNRPAQRANEGAGFKVVDEVKHPSFEATFGTPGLRRLLRR